MKHVRMTMPGVALALLLVASGCGSTSTAATGSASSGPSQQAAQGVPGGGQQGRMPGASGTIVDVSGSTMQVQGLQSDQVAVTWTGRTSFTDEASGTLSDVAVGSCVMVTSDGAGSTSSSPATVTATAVRGTKATNGSCSIGGGPGGGGRPGGGSGMPGGAASGRPDGGPSGRPGGAGVVGMVKAMTGGGFTVTSQGFGQDSGSSTVTVSTTSKTTVSRTVAATSKAVRTGLCVSARGSADDTGAVTATSVALSQPVNGACGMGFGRPGGAGGAGGQSSSTVS